MTTSTTVRHLRTLVRHLEDNDFSTVPQDKALRQAIATLQTQASLATLVQDLWWFIENVDEDTPDRTDRFFGLRERKRPTSRRLAIMPQTEREKR
jgi:hypothetical protein